VAPGEGAAEVGVGTQVHGRLVLLVLDGEVGGVGSQEAGDRRRRLFVCTLTAQTHQQLQQNTIYRIGF